MGNVIEHPDVRLDIDDDDRLYEVIDGNHLKKRVGASEVYLANLIAIAINAFALPQRLGIAVLEMLLDFGQPDLPQFRPDLCYVSNERSPLSKRRIPRTNAWAVIPEVAVEVVSPSNTADEIQNKVERYLKEGVKVVWVVYPELATVHVHDGSSTTRIVKGDGVLDAKAVIPGFTLPLAHLFEAEAETG